MLIDPALLDECGIDQETFDHLRKNSPGFRAYTREEYRALDEEELWRDQCRDQLQRSPERWVQNGFVHRNRPILDDEPVRSFATLAQYRAWCATALPKYLGFDREDRPPETTNAAR